MSMSKNNTNTNLNSEWSTVTKSSDKKEKALARKKRQDAITAFSKDYMPRYRECVKEDCIEAYIENQPRLYPIGKDVNYDYAYDQAFEAAVTKALRKFCGCGQERFTCQATCHYSDKCEEILLDYYNEWLEDPEEQLIYKMRNAVIVDDDEGVDEKEVVPEPKTPPPAPRKVKSLRRKAPSPIKTGRFSALMMSDEDEGDEGESLTPLTPSSREPRSFPLSIKRVRKNMGK